MYRRLPTRIELKIDDLQEYEVMKKEWDEKKSPQEMNASTGKILDASSTAHAKLTVHERIGYKPEPRVPS